jgi:hypothetical protein|tara:strand:- start:333 stop:521 length:189 start_codon:yes stop_codon:yes gene_type:complete
MKTFWKARLTKKGEFLSAELFETIEEAKIWGMSKAKLLVSDTFLKTCKVDDVVVEITSHEFA